MKYIYIYIFIKKIKCGIYLLRLFGIHWHIQGETLHSADSGVGGKTVTGNIINSLLPRDAFEILGFLFSQKVLSSEY